MARRLEAIFYLPNFHVPHTPRPMNSPQVARQKVSDLCHVATSAAGRVMGKWPRWDGDMVDPIRRTSQLNKQCVNKLTSQILKVFQVYNKNVADLSYHRPEKKAFRRGKRRAGRSFCLRLNMVVSPKSFSAPKSFERSPSTSFDRTRFASCPTQRCPGSSVRR